MQWNDFKENITTSFKELREDREFTDVTLACEDGEQIEAHKVVLVSSSPFFLELLKKCRHPHPLLYMRGFQSEDLIRILDFLYCGEANVFQDNLDTFLALAEELRLKGLTGEAKAEKEPLLETPQSKRIPPKKELSKKFPARVSEPNDTTVVITETLMNDKVSTDIHDLNQRIKSMITRSEQSAGPGQGLMASCNICGKQGAYRNMPNHVETNHITGISHACDLCGKICRSRNALKMHIFWTWTM